MPTKKKTTIYDVAQHANVAISTVSRVLNQSPDVSDQTRAKVLAAIEDLQFRPARTARNLAQQTTRALAVAIPSFTTPFHNELLKGIRDRLADEDVDLLLCDLGSRNRRQTLLNFLHRGAVDGLLLVGVRVDERVQRELDSLRAPVVLVGSPADAYDSFFWDDVAGAKLGTNHLIRRGHTRIGMICAAGENISQAPRLDGYRAALADADLPVQEDWVVYGDTIKHGGYS